MNCFIGRLLLVLAATMTASSCTEGDKTTGIDGTGVRAPTLAAASHGRITQLVGGVVVNGITYDPYEATVTIDGKPATVADLAAGDVVSVKGAVPSQLASTGVAHAIRLDHMLIGAVSAIDLSNAALVVLGRTVHAADAVFDSTSLPQGLVGLKVGDLIEVSGFRNGSDEVVASRIGKRSRGGEYRTIGVVATVDEQGKVLSIGPQVVDFSWATVVPGPSGRLEQGDTVDVRAAQITQSGVLVAEQIAYRAADVVATPGDRVALEGYVTTIDVTDPQRFKVAGLSIETTAQTQVQGTLAVNARTEVRGPLSAAGALRAETIRSPVDTTPGTHTVDGLVFDANRGPIADAPINLWVQLAREGYSYWWARGPLRSDAIGRYRAIQLPDSRIALWAAKPGYVQPCGIDIDLRASVTVDIEVMAEETFDSLSPPRPISAGEPTFTGTVYEDTPSGLQPVPGARIAAEKFEDVSAVTLSDLRGHFFLCKLPPAGIEIWVMKPGYKTKTVFPVDTSRSNTLDIVIERL
jgi:hypothetical protein